MGGPLSVDGASGAAVPAPGSGIAPCREERAIGLNLDPAAPAQQRQAQKVGPRLAKPDFDGFVLLCQKCRKRQGLGRRTVGRALRRAFRREGLGRALRVVETGCLGPCPKRTLALATPAALGRGRVLLLDPALLPDAVREVLTGAAARRGTRAAGAASDG